MTEVTKTMIMRANMDLRQLGIQVNLNESEIVRLSRLTRDFQQVMEQFQEIQRIYLGKCRDFVVRAKAITEVALEESEEQNEKDLEAALLFSPEQ